MTTNNPPQLPQPRTRVIPTWKMNEMIASGEIVLDAPYQRDVVWENEKMSALISSMLNNFYVPPILVAVRESRQHGAIRVVIDGKQRLTSTARFMRNLVPYMDWSSEEEVPTYYSGEQFEFPNDTPEDIEYRRKLNQQHFLSAELFERFNRYEFVCVEYMDITEDDEFDLFARVQLGKPATPAEILKAHNTPRAELCRQLAATYAPIAKICQNTAAPYFFKTVLLMLYSIPIEDPKVFSAAPKALNEFVSSQEAPSEALKEKMNKVLKVLHQFATKDAIKKIVTEFDNKVYHLRVLETLLFAIYVSHVQRPRSIENYAHDFKNLRTFLMDHREGKMHLGKDSFKQGYTWIDDYLDTSNLRAVRRPQIFHALDSDDDDDDHDIDELKAETDPEPPQPQPQSQQQHSHSHSHSQSKRFRGVSVARRGGASNGRKFRRV